MTIHERSHTDLVFSETQTQRLDVCVMDALQMNRAQVQVYIKSGQVLVNDKQEKPGYKLKLEDRVSILTLELSAPEKRDVPKLDVLYEDEDLLVVDKPVNMLVYPVHSDEASLLDFLRVHTKGKLALAAGENRPGIVHRLDRNTRGVLLIAKHDEAYYFLREQFEKRTIEKRYYARVKGSVEDDEFFIEKAIGQQKSGIKQDISPQSKYLKEAKTHCKVIKRSRSASLLNIRLITG